jgi:peptide/nickel transport system permease protein
MMEMASSLIDGVSHASYARPTLRRLFFSSITARAATGVFALLVIVAFLAPFLAPQNPYDLATVSVADSELPPGAMASTGAFRYWLGTDGLGRDLLSAILYGLRISIGVGIISVLVASAIGTSIGLVAAYAGRRLDAFLMRLVDLQLSVPTILVALVLLAVLGQGLDKTLIALVTVQWAYYARQVRGAALVERKKEYIEAAIGQGLPAVRIMVRHLLPNCLPPLMVTATLQTGYAITLEATLSFLGVGLPQTQPSLGRLISNGFEYMLSNEYWISIFPGVALVALIAAINLIGDHLRAALSPYASAEA